MTPNEYQILASRTMNPKLTKEQELNHALYGMVGEIGEIHSIYQKELQEHPIDLVHVQKECGDLLWFIAELHTHYGWSLEDTMKMNIEKLKKRYPDKGFDADRSLHRAANDI